MCKTADSDKELLQVAVVDEQDTLLMQVRWRVCAVCAVCVCVCVCLHNCKCVSRCVCVCLMSCTCCIYCPQALACSKHTPGARVVFVSYVLCCVFHVHCSASAFLPSPPPLYPLLPPQIQELVLPSAPVLDYRTELTGIQASDLQGVTLTRKAAAKRISKLLTPHTVLVGHGLHHDLAALQLDHPWVIDTSIIFTFK